MSQERKHMQPNTASGAMSVKCLPLLALLAQMRRRDATAAWDEFQERRYLYWDGAGPLCLTDFYCHLRDTPRALELAGGRTEATDRAYDLALDHFLRPDGARNGRRHGVDSRRYVRALGRVARRAVTRARVRTAAAKDAVAVSAAQRFLSRIMWRASLEALRGTPGPRSRFRWTMLTGGITVWMPVYYAGRKRRRWLEENISDADPRRPNERKRVQGIIDQHWGKLTVGPLGPADAVAAPESANDDVAAHLSPLKDLPQRVAQEKAARPGLLGPALRRLGPVGIAHLTENILIALRDGCYHGQQLAANAVTSSATVSRYAPPRWRGRTDGPVPMLFANVAVTLAANDAFVAAAKAARVWPVVQDVLKRYAQRNSRRQSDVT